VIYKIILLKINLKIKNESEICLKFLNDIKDINNNKELNIEKIFDQTSLTPSSIKIKYLKEIIQKNLFVKILNSLKNI